MFCPIRLSSRLLAVDSWGNQRSFSEETLRTGYCVPRIEQYAKSMGLQEGHFKVFLLALVEFAGRDTEL